MQPRAAEQLLKHQIVVCKLMCIDISHNCSDIQIEQTNAGVPILVFLLGMDWYGNFRPLPKLKLQIQPILINKPRMHMALRLL